MTLILPIRHLKQTSNWDCGVTCLRMLIDYYHLDLSLFDHLCDTYQCNNSTWTIDLLHLLHQSGIDATLHTITIGCSPTYNDTPYYKSLIVNDRERVNKLFHDKASNVKLGSISWSDLKSHLIEYRTPCLVLIDADKIECCTCKKTTFDRILDKFIPTLSSYQGHYILVIGYTINEGQELIRYTDPGVTDGFCTTTKENFDQARTAFGTDEDVYFILWKNFDIKMCNTTLVFARWKFSPFTCYFYYIKSQNNHS